MTANSPQTASTRLGWAVAYIARRRGPNPGRCVGRLT
jgi:hypothetical protein